MPTPTLTPASTTSTIALKSVGDSTKVAAAVPLGVYTSVPLQSEIDLFTEGAAEQVSYVYQKLGGDVMDIEITNDQVYASYEQACIVYSKMINIHQSENVLSNVLGAATGTFDHEGQILETEGDVTNTSNYNLKYPKFDFSYARRVTEGISAETGLGGSTPVYSASFDLIDGQQDYNLQKLLEDDPAFTTIIGGNQVLIKRVFYKTRRAMWNFYGLQGSSMRSVGSAGGYSRFADSSTFEVIPVWQQKLEAINYEDHIKTRTSDCSYEIRNNQLRIFPTPSQVNSEKMWIEFQIPRSPWTDTDSAGETGTSGINNLNNIPFQNLPFSSINQIGKQWIRDYSFSLSKEMLGIVRSKFSSIPTPGGEITLNGTQLISDAKAEMEALVTELKEALEKMTYSEMMKSDAEVLEASEKIMKEIPSLIYVG